MKNLSEALAGNRLLTARNGAVIRVRHSLRRTFPQAS